MRTFISILFAATFLIAASCKQQKEVVAEQKPNHKEAVKPVQPNQPAVLIASPAMDEPIQEEVLPESMYRLIIAFISEGEGTSASSYETLTKLISDHETTFGVPLRYDKFQRGKEGEFTMCFKLLNENGKARNNFISKVKESFAGNKMVIVSENAVYNK